MAGSSGRRIRSPLRKSRGVVLKCAQLRATPLERPGANRAWFLHGRDARAASGPAVTHFRVSFIGSRRRGHEPFGARSRRELLIGSARVAGQSGETPCWAPRASERPGRMPRPQRARRPRFVGHTSPHRVIGRVSILSSSTRPPWPLRHLPVTRLGRTSPRGGDSRTSRATSCAGRLYRNRE